MIFTLQKGMYNLGRKLPKMPRTLDRLLANAISSTRVFPYQAAKNWPDNRYDHTADILAESISTDTIFGKLALENISPDRIRPYADTVTATFFTNIRKSVEDEPVDYDGLIGNVKRRDNFTWTICLQAGIDWPDEFFDRYKQVLVEGLIDKHSLDTAMRDWPPDRSQYIETGTRERLHLTDIPHINSMDIESRTQLYQFTDQFGPTLVKQLSLQELELVLNVYQNAVFLGNSQAFYEGLTAAAENGDTEKWAEYILEQTRSDTIGGTNFRWEAA